MAGKKDDLSDKVFCITGANTGIGFITAKWLLKYKATVLMCCRNENKAIQAREELMKENECNEEKIHIIILDLSDLNTIQGIKLKLKFKKIQKIDCLINNAGIMFVPKYEESPQGYEMQWATNYLGHFYLTQKLMEFLNASEEPRVINVSSQNHWLMASKNIEDVLEPMNESNYNAKIAYGDSKCCNILFTMELVKQYPNLQSYALHPGWVWDTQLANHLKMSFGGFSGLVTGVIKSVHKIGSFFINDAKSVEQGASTVLFCSISNQENLSIGAYYKDCVLSQARKDLTNEIAKQLWEKTKNKIKK